MEACVCIPHNISFVQWLCVLMMCLGNCVMLTLTLFSQDCVCMPFTLYIYHCHDFR